MATDLPQPGRHHHIIPAHPQRPSGVPGIAHVQQARQDALEEGGVDRSTPEPGKVPGAHMANPAVENEMPFAFDLMGLTPARTAIILLESPAA